MADVGTPAARAAARGRAGRERELCDLLVRVGGGEAAAMARFYDLTSAAVFAFVSRLVGRRDLAEEVALDVYVHAWRRAATFDAERGDATTWLLTIARSRALDRRRADAARANHEARLGEGDYERAAAGLVDDTNPLLERVRAECGERVRASLAALSEPQRRAIELAYFLGLSHSEIAARLGEPLGTVKTRIRLGMIRLKDALVALEDER
jgi:RNA polymerase sigma-70 factor (ECF subfamily)